MDGTFLEIDLYDDILDTSSKSKENTQKNLEIDYGEILENTPDKEVDLLEGFKPVNIGLDSEHYRNEILKKIQDLSDKEKDQIMKDAEFYLEKFKVLKSQKKVLKSQKKLVDIELPENEELKKLLQFIPDDEITSGSHEVYVSKIIEKLEILIDVKNEKNEKIEKLQNDVTFLKDDVTFLKDYKKIEAYNEVFNRYTDRLKISIKQKEKEKKNFIESIFETIINVLKWVIILSVILTIVVQVGNFNVTPGMVITENKIEDVILEQNVEMLSKIPIKTYIPQYELLEDVYDKTVSKVFGIAFDIVLHLKDLIVDLIDK